MENGETDPLLEHEEKDDDDDDDEGTTNPFQPGGASTPGPSGEQIPLTTMNREKEKEPSTAETSFIKGSPLSRVLTSNAKAMNAPNKTIPCRLSLSYPLGGSRAGNPGKARSWIIISYLLIRCN